MIQPSKYQPDQEVRPATRLQRIWEDGGFALTVQTPSFMAARLGDVLTQVAAQISGFDAVLVAEASGGAIALSSMALAVLFQRAGLSPIAQLSGRDRNRLALQGDILGLGALNIPYVLVDTLPIGRASLGRNPDARLVADLDGPALLATAARLRDEARFLSGASIKTPPVFSLGALIDLADPLPTEQLQPAQFLVAAPVSDVHLLPALLTTFQHMHAAFLSSRPLLVSIPFASPASARDQDPWQACLEVMRVLQKFSVVRGCNVVVKQLADLDLLEQGTGSGLFSLERPE